MSELIQFELWVKGRRRGQPFASDVDPYDNGECADLLRTQARAAKARVGECELIVRRGGRQINRVKTAN